MLLSATFGDSLAGNPAWGMLLDLYIWQCEGRPVLVSGLCDDAEMPESTALRYVRHFRDIGLIQTDDVWADERSAGVSLTELGVRKLNGALDGVTISNAEHGIGHLRLVQ